MDNLDKLKDLVERIEIYTIGRPKTEKVHMTVKDLQNIADELSTIISEQQSNDIDQDILDAIDQADHGWMF